ncbi:unnamed protein product [Caenorhabditis auriculariae]|uniref:Uncharacterized protein n=1 Tax=Caenorhabditis auriculariae TaxID=2777116 RepID=A0A8S1H6U3_9PELO|nr:unnamed protein product [Caenorhabditis auriculariae]
MVDGVPHPPTDFFAPKEKNYYVRFGKQSKTGKKMEDDHPSTQKRDQSRADRRAQFEQPFPTETAKIMNEMETRPF